MASKQAERKPSIQAKPSGSRAKTPPLAPKVVAAQRASALVKPAPVKKGALKRPERVAITAAVAGKSSVAKSSVARNSSARASSTPRFEDVPASMPAQNWPQAMSSGGSAVAHAGNGKSDWERGAETIAQAAPDIASAVVTSTVANAPATAALASTAVQTGTVVARPMIAALEIQAAMYRTALRYAPFTLAFNGALRGQAMLLRMMRGYAANDRSKA